MNPRARRDRRRFLRGAFGTAIALPFLESRADRAYAATPVKRFVGLYHPNGVFTPQWFPTRPANAPETEFELGPLHEPLAAWKSKLLFTGGIDMKVAVAGPGEMHQRGVGGWLTGSSLGKGSFVGNDGSRAGYAQGISLDQALVPLIGAETSVKSLQLGVHALTPNVAGVVSYQGPDQPLLPQNDPKLTFRTLFGTEAVVLDELAAGRRSVLDAVRGQIRNLQMRVSASDRTRLDRHFTLLRELEAKVTKVDPVTCGPRTPPAAIEFASEVQMQQVAQVQLDLLVTAFRCDLARVATIMVGDALNHNAIPHLDIRTDVHNLTHLSDSDAARTQVGVRDKWVASLLGRLLLELEATEAPGGGSALDHTLVFWGTDVSRGNTHAHDDMPFVLAGGGAGFKMGRYVRWDGAPHNDLLVSILNGFGSEVSTFGAAEHCRGPLANLT
ncbi:MAG: DUF1552 domain-containing protein [Myxococcales bacterium]|nr:DUF1552 domain-containing protein [Myxococcales bacterium]